MRRATVACATLALAAGLGGVGAASPPDAGGGLTCGVTGQYDPQSRPTDTGTVTAGPWIVPTSDPTASVRIRCTLQAVWQQMPPQVVSVVDSGVRPVLAAIPPTPITFERPEAGVASLEMCTDITIYHSAQPPTVYRYDADGNPSNGAQCKHVDDGSDATHVYVGEEDPDGPTCIRVQHNLPPWYYNDVCPPVLM